MSSTHTHTKHWKHRVGRWILTESIPDWSTSLNQIPCQPSWQTRGKPGASGLLPHTKPAPWRQSAGTSLIATWLAAKLGSSSQSHSYSLSSPWLGAFNSSPTSPILYSSVVGNSQTSIRNEYTWFFLILWEVSSNHSSGFIAVQTKQISVLFAQSICSPVVILCSYCFQLFPTPPRGSTNNGHFSETLYGASEFWIGDLIQFLSYHILTEFVCMSMWQIYFIIRKSEDN